MYLLDEPSAYGYIESITEFKVHLIDYCVRSFSNSKVVEALITWYFPSKICAL